LRLLSAGNILVSDYNYFLTTNNLN